MGSPEFYAAEARRKLVVGFIISHAHPVIPVKVMASGPAQSATSWSSGA
ncbi:hypothetical protein [Hyalangium rubrum]|uniref:Uncharacterized protein n=1 Tax=Hyalangium rubrum TaxID=3103134 RepID=A0ABU5HJ07_9BACT|nr:hypothetical protein [Hyalangium sp. s54d21]MDY7232828.1 hypothetical protein [Hyalangium sp. s54d21]